MHGFGMGRGKELKGRVEEENERGKTKGGEKKRG
jgi:hypothetical protein